MINDLFLFPKNNFLFLMEKNKFPKNNFDFELQFSTSHLADETMSEYPLEVIWPRVQQQHSLLMRSSVMAAVRALHFVQQMP